MKTVFVSGATGYIGNACARSLEEKGYRVLRGSRRRVEAAVGEHWFEHADLTSPHGLAPMLESVDVVIHCAGLSHVPDDSIGANRALEVNAVGTASLAEASAQAGVTRFVLMSTALVLGACNVAMTEPFRDGDSPLPASAYARSKFAAEQSLAEIATSRGMQWIALRPPLVYGPGSPGNFSRLLRLVASGVPLPLGSATAPRSVIGLANLVSAVDAVIEHPEAANHTFLVADQELTSTADLVTQIARALDKPARLFSIHPELLRASAAVFGQSRNVARLLDPFAVVSRQIDQLVGWCAPNSQKLLVREAVRHWVAQCS